MNYTHSYRNNPSFPYSKRKISNHSQSEKIEQKTTQKSTVSTKKEQYSSLNSSFFNSILLPIEKLIGKKIEIDDLLLLLLIYILLTEKETENDSKTLLLCLLFIILN